MSRSTQNDRVLRAIAEEALDFFSRHVDVGKVQCIILTGSVANGEGTVIDYNNRIFASDFDFVIYLSFLDFFKRRAYLAKLSHEITRKLMKRGIDTHVVFVPSTNIPRILSEYVDKGIYEYEFALASKCLLGEAPRFDKGRRPTSKDALELTFTVISDLLFLKLKRVSRFEESYIYAKRALTLLNSLLIFCGFYAETYEKRTKGAKEISLIEAIPINNDEMKTLEIFTEYKLSGSFQHLLDSLGYEKAEDVINFQKSFLKRMAAKILHYELINLTDKQGEKNLTGNNSLLTRLPKLLKKYSIYSRERLSTRIMGVLLSIFWLFSRDLRKKEMFVTYIFHRQSPKTILNVLVTLLLMYGHKISIRKLLREVFPWISFNKTNVAQELSSLWQTAELSIDLK